MLNTHKSKFYMISSRITIKKLIPLIPLILVLMRQKVLEIKLNFNNLN
jgi:hypothetical protein